MQDGPGNDWPPELVASIIAQKAADCQSDMVCCTSQVSTLQTPLDGAFHCCLLLQIITFDAQGVSQHPNHIAVWKGAM